AEMHAPAGELGEQDVALDHDLLRRGGDSLQAKPSRDEALVHHAPRRERWLLAVVGDRDIEGAGVLERGAHQVARGDGLAVVRDGDRPRPYHLAELRELLAALAHRDRADRVDAGEPGAQRLAHDEADGGLVVGDGVRVGHGAHGREPARHSRARPGRDGLFVLVARLAEMDVDVHESRRDDRAAHVAHGGSVRCAEARAHGGDAAVLDQHGSGRVQVAARVHRPAALEQQRCRHQSVPPAAGPLAASASSGLPPASRYSTAMRTATPFVTWSRMTLWGPSATRESISTPRFIGPGCMTVSARGALASRSTVTPNTR